MVIVIDGYNLLKQLYPNSKKNLAIPKKKLLQQLGLYKKIKTGIIHDLIVVFDGGILSKASREIHNGIVILEAGYKRSADDWIIEFVERNKGKDITIVSMDRKLCLSCEALGAFSTDVFDFTKNIQQLIIENHFPIQENTSSDSIKKFDTANFEPELELPADNLQIDKLMELYSETSELKDQKLEKNSPLRVKNLSKKEKALAKKAKKIY